MTAVDIPSVKLPSVAAVVTAVCNPWKPTEVALVEGVPNENDPDIPELVIGFANVMPVWVVVTLGVKPVDGADVAGTPKFGPVQGVPGTSPVFAVDIVGVPKVNPAAVVVVVPNDNPVCPADVATLPNEIPPACPTLGVPKVSAVGVDVVPNVSPVDPTEETGVPNDRPEACPAGFPNNPVLCCEVAGAPNDKPEDNVEDVPNTGVLPNKVPGADVVAVVPSVNPDVVVLKH